MIPAVSVPSLDPANLMDDESKNHANTWLDDDNDDDDVKKVVSRSFKKVLAGLVAIFIILLLVLSHPRSPDFFITSTLVTDSASPPANIQLTLSVHNPINKLDTRYQNIRAMAFYTTPSISMRWELAAFLHAPQPFDQANGDETTVDVLLQGSIDPEVAARITRNSVNIIFFAQVKNGPWLPLSNNVVAVCRDIQFAKESENDLHLPIKCQNLQ